MPKNITRKQAETALASVRDQFRAYLGEGAEEPVLREPGEECSGWSIAWEGGPHEWAYIAFSGGFDDEMYHLAREFVDDEQARKSATKPAVPAPKGVHVEAVNTWCLGLYPDE